MNWSDQAVELRKLFANDGYLLMRQALSPDFVDEVQGNVDRFIREIVPTLSRDQVYYEQLNDRSTIKQVPHLDQYDDYFDRFQKQGPLHELAEVLLDTPVRPDVAFPLQTDPVFMRESHPGEARKGFFEDEEDTAHDRSDY